MVCGNGEINFSDFFKAKTNLNERQGKQVKGYSR